MATEIKKTVQDVLQIISDLRGETAVNTDASRIRAVSRAEKDFSKRRYWRYYLIQNQTTAGSGANAYSIGSTAYPMRYKGLTEVFVGGTSEEDRHTLVDFNKYKMLYNRNNSNRIVYEYYDVMNDAWKMYINPAPSATDTITYSYFFEPPTRTLTSDSVVCPNIDIIARLALAYIYEGEDENKYVEQLQIAESLISQYEGQDDSPAVNQFYAVEAVENQPYIRGIGMY